MIFALLAIFILALVLPFSLLSAPSWSTDSLILYGLLVLCSIKLGYLIYKAEFRPIAFTFWIFVYSWGLLSPLLQTSLDRFPWPVFHSLQSQREAIWLLLLAMICFEAGYSRQVQFKNYANWRLELNPRKILIISILVLIWTIAHIILAGGPNALMVSRGLVKRAITSTADSSAEGFIRIASLRAPIFLYVLIVAHMTLRRRINEQLAENFRKALLWILLLLLPLHFVANYPNAQTRAWLGALTVAPALLLMPRQRQYIFAFIVGFIVTILIVFPQLDSNRSRGQNVSMFEKFKLDDQVLQNTRKDLIKSADFDVFQQFCNSIEYLKHNKIMWGRNILGAGLFWVPRSVWPDKPIGSGHVVAIYFQNPNINLSSPLWMEFYLAFGGLGIAILMFLYGKGTAYIDNRFQYAVESHELITSAFPVLAAFWAGYQFMVLRGSLLYSVTIASVPILVLLLSASRNSGEQNVQMDQSSARL